MRVYPNIGQTYGSSTDKCYELSRLVLLEKEAHNRYVLL